MILDGVAKTRLEQRRMAYLAVPRCEAGATTPNSLR
jgi:hypothetical protein